MANIEKRKTKSGTSYRITVEDGSDYSGKRIRHRMTFIPEPGMTQKQIDKAVQRAAADFERSIELGYALDNRQTFAEYAKYVLDLKLQNGLKIRTYERYTDLMIRTNEAIGHIKLADLRPQHLNQFYTHLLSPGVRAKGGSATPKIDIAVWLKEHHLPRAELARRSGVSPVTVGTAARGNTISDACAKAIAGAMEMKIADAFTVQKDERKLSEKTVLEYHRLIRSILAQAEKEMLVAYNAADKASPPRPGDLIRTIFSRKSSAKFLQQQSSCLCGGKCSFIFSSSPPVVGVKQWPSNGARLIFRTEPCGSTAHWSIAKSRSFAKIIPKPGTGVLWYCPRKPWSCSRRFVKSSFACGC